MSAFYQKVFSRNFLIRKNCLPSCFCKVLILTTSSVNRIYNSVGEKVFGHSSIFTLSGLLSINILHVCLFFCIVIILLLAASDPHTWKLFCQYFVNKTKEETYIIAVLLLLYIEYKSFLEYLVYAVHSKCVSHYLTVSFVTIFSPYFFHKVIVQFCSVDWRYIFLIVRLLNTVAQQRKSGRLRCGRKFAQLQRTDETTAAFFLSFFTFTRAAHSAIL